MTAAGAVVKLTASEIVADTAYNIVTGSLYLSCPKITGTQTGTPVQKMVGTIELGDKEDALGNPDVDDYVLSSKTDGTRSWVEMTGGGDALLLDQTTPQSIINGSPINLSEPEFTYTGGALTRVDYPSGFYKTLSYNVDGTLNVITYSNGHTKTMVWSSGNLTEIETT
jgi:hypothetical protein